MTERSPADRPSADVPRIVAGSPSDDETAAVAAVFAQLLAERAASTVVLDPGAPPSAWARSTRALRRSAPTRPAWGAPAD